VKFCGVRNDEIPCPRAERRKALITASGLESPSAGQNRPTRFWPRRDSIFQNPKEAARNGAAAISAAAQKMPRFSKRHRDDNQGNQQRRANQGGRPEDALSIQY
jgi:hypothetical protein